VSYMRNRKEMTIRVASRYMKEAGILNNIIDFFSEPPREKEQLKKRPVFDTSKAWITFGMYGTSTGEVSHKLKLKGEDAGIIEIKGMKIKISLDREMVRGMKDDGGFIGNTFTTITLSGVDENIPKRELDRILDQMLEESRISSRIIYTSEPRDHHKKR